MNEAIDFLRMKIEIHIIPQIIYLCKLNIARDNCYFSIFVKLKHENSIVDKVCYIN